MRLFAFLLVLLACCAPHTAPSTVWLPRAEATKRSIPVWVHQEFTEPEVRGIVEAMTLWNDALSGHVHMWTKTIDFDLEMGEIHNAYASRGFILLRVPSDSKTVVESGLGGNVLAFVDDVGGHVVYMIHDRIKAQHFGAIAAHELGHLLGVKHGGSYLMAAAFNGVGYDCVDAYTAREVEKAQNLPYMSVSYCHK